MKIISWNCRGVGNDDFRLSCKDMLRVNNPDVICFLETKTADNPRFLNFMKSRGFDADFPVPDVLSSTTQLIHCSLA